MTELSGYVLETLWEGSEFGLYRGRQPGNAVPVLLRAPVSVQQTSANLRWLEHAYSLADELDPAWAVRPLALARHNGRTALLLEDPGGEPLARMLGRPLELTRFLHIAISLTAALRQVHQHGLIHKDIKPANVLVDAAGNVRLMGFGIASRLPRERQAPAPPEVIAGTFAYMAPEQTGRMNRSIDSRSDLYALGVTLYEMLTGVLPFTASDPMEWIHCHIARRPTPPSERVDGVPNPVEAIVLKLLAKSAEDRYQTAAGVEADLRACLTAWEAHGRIDPFPLGAHDVSDRLLIPEKLYGREAEIDALVAAFDRVVTSGATELVLVSGYAGIGKSSLVNELHKELVPPRGAFRRRQVRPVQARHPLCDAGSGVPEPGRSDPRQERRGAEPMARRVAGGAGPERPAHGQSGPGACADHRRAAAGARPSAPGPAGAVPAGVPAISSACLPGRSTRSRCSSTICNGWTRRPSI